MSLSCLLTFFLCVMRMKEVIVDVFNDEHKVT